MRNIALVLLLTLAASTTYAVIETYEFSSPALEARYKALSQELRCPKCQNQNIADSNADISRDLRAIVHEQLEAGASDEEIIAFLVDRYGEFVRYRPGMDSNTFWLWSMPILLFLMGLAVILIQMRKGREATNTAADNRADMLRKKHQEETLND